LCLAGGLPASLPAQTTIDIPTARQLIVGLLRAGQPAAAREVTLGLLAAHPDDPTLLINLSQAERNLGNLDAALRAGRAAYAAARDDTERHYAALVTAQALSSDGHRLRAQFWLRRAVQHAPTEQERARAIRDFRYVGDRNPLSVELRAGISPTDNINNGPTTNRIVFNGITFVNDSLVPIPGIELTFGGDAKYRLIGTPDFIGFATFGYDGLRGWLDSDAATIDPTLRNRDLSQDHLRFGLEGNWRLDDAGGVATAEAEVSRSYYGGAHIQDGGVVSLGYARPLDDRFRLRGMLRYATADRIDRPVRSAQTAHMGFGLDTRLPNQDLLSLDLHKATVSSDSSAVARAAFGVDIRYARAEPLAGLMLSVDAGWERSVYDLPLYSADVRDDDRFSASVGAVISQVDYYGFSPRIDLRWERNLSNVTTFDTESIALGIGFQSSF
jgi:hypothetical protein